MHHNDLKMKYIIKEILLTSFILIMTFGQIYCQVQDSLYVWASPGLNIRKTSNPNSEIISNIPFGEKILPDWKETSENIDLRIKETAFVNNKETPELFLKGRMVKVNYNDQVGFVFSGFLSRFPTHSSENLFFDDFLLQEFDTIKTFRYNNHYYSDQKFFDNGIVLFSLGDGAGCQENTYIIPGISLNEGFLIVYQIFKLGNKDSSSYEYPDWYVVENNEDSIEIKGIYQLDFYASIRKTNNFVTISIFVGN